MKVDLLTLRRIGLFAKNWPKRTPALARVGAEYLEDGDDHPITGIIEKCLAEAIWALDEGERCTRAMRYLFGLESMSRSLPVEARRELAAQAYGQLPETFRRNVEDRLISHIADRLLRNLADHRSALA